MTIYKAAIAGFCSFVFSTSIALADTRPWFHIDCRSALMNNENTENDVLVEFWEDDKMVYQTIKSAKSGFEQVVLAVFDNFLGTGGDLWVDGPPNCNSVHDADYPGRGRPTDIIIRATGDDALFIDRAYFDQPDRKDVTWGVNGGNGLCLSTDPSDGEGAWKDHVPGCQEAIRFEIKSGNAFTVRKKP